MSFFSTGPKCWTPEDNKWNKVRKWECYTYTWSASALLWHNELSLTKYRQKCCLWNVKPLHFQSHEHRTSMELVKTCIISHNVQLFLPLCHKSYFFSLVGFDHLKNFLAFLILNRWRQKIMNRISNSRSPPTSLDKNKEIVWYTVVFQLLIELNLVEFTENLMHFGHRPCAHYNIKPKNLE